MKLGLLFKRILFAGRGRSYDHYEWVQLRTAIGMDDPDDIRRILSTGANLKGALGYDSSFPGEGPLYAALAQKRYKAAGALMAAQPEWLTETNANGDTLLHRMAAINSDAAEFLAARGADIDAKNRKGQTPVMLAINAGSFDAAVVLANAGAKVDLGDPVVEKALRVATVEMHTDFLKTIGRLQAEATAAEQAHTEDVIGTIRNGTANPVRVRKLQLKL